MRQPNIRSAGSDLAFVVLALVAGWAGAPLLYGVAILAGAALVWWWTRRAALAAMPLRPRLTNTALALAMLAVVLGLMFWIGRMAGGHP